jgi:hypothetical protein
MTQTSVDIKTSAQIAAQVQAQKAMVPLDPKIISSLVLSGDLSKLTTEQTMQYYVALCDRIGIDPATQPFKLLTLNGKKVMYCDRGGTAQISKLYKISHEQRSTETVSDVYTVNMRASMDGGRFTDSSGSVSIAGLKGDALANALMKAQTKAKRRATLDLIGLGMLDESEIETIPGDVRREALPQLEVKAQENTQEPPPRHSLGFEGIICPLGPNKGKRMIDLAIDTLQNQLTWLMEKEKFPDYANAISAYLGDLNLLTLPQDEPTQEEPNGDAPQGEIEAPSPSVAQGGPSPEAVQVQNSDFGVKRTSEIMAYIKRAPAKARLIGASKATKHAHENGDITDLQFQEILLVLEKKEGELAK